MNYIFIIFPCMCLLLWDTPISSQLAVCFLWPYLVGEHVFNVCMSLVSYPCVQKYFYCCIFSLVSVGRYGLGFFLCVFSCPPPFLVVLNSIVHTSAATFRLHISAWNDLIWLSWCLSCVVIFTFVVIISVNAAYSFAFDNTKFIKTSSFSPCL